VPDERMQQWLAGLGVPPAILAMVENIPGNTSTPAGNAAPAASGTDGVGAITAGLLRQAATALPRPMQPDCKILRNKVPGPRNIVLCATHGHVVDTDTQMIVAKDVADYKARAKTAAVDTAKTIGKATIAGVEAIPGGKTVIDGVKGALADAAQLPRPMQPDCKLVHGKVPGPKNHLLCAAHGHVVDIKTNMIIANDVASYKETAAAAKAVQGVVKKALTAVENAAADAKKRADAEAAAQKEAEIDKAVGVVPVEISLLVNGVDGPADGLKLLASASADHGVGEGRGYVNALRENGKGFYAGKGVPIPSTGILYIGTDKETIRFDILRYTAPANGVLRLKATEKPATGNAKLRHFELTIDA
jgi:hypothetical protein